MNYQAHFTAEDAEVFPKVAEKELSFAYLCV